MSVAHVQDLVQVDYDPAGRPTFAVALQSEAGELLRLERDNPEVVEIEELAFQTALQSELRPLPRGSFEVVIRRDEWGRLPDSLEVGRIVARHVLAA